MAILLSTNGNLEPTDNLSGNLGVTGTTNLNTLTVTGNTSINNLTVLGTTNISTLVSTASTINGNLTVTGTTSLNTLTASTSTINGNLTVTGTTSLGTLTSTASTINGNLTVTGTTSVRSLSATTLNLSTIGSGTSVNNLGVDSSGNVVSGTTQFLKFTADTTITQGNAVRLLENGRIARTDFNPTGSTLPIIGIAQQSGTTGSTVQVAVENEISYVQSGLLPGFNYYANTDGSLSLNGNTYMGVALSSTQLNLMFSNPAGNSIPSLSVIDNTITNPANITIPGRYIVPVSGLTGSFVGNQNDYADYDGNLFTFTLPTNNDKAVITTGPNSGNVYIFSTGATSGWTLSSQSSILSTSNWISSSSYKQNDMVIYQSVLYQANGDIPANTAFNVGTSGATFKQIGVSGVAEYGELVMTLGTLTVTGTTTTTAQTFLTFTLPSAGVWEIEPVVYSALDLSSMLNYGVYNSSGTLIANSESRAGFIGATSFQGNGSTVVYVTTTQPETYTVRAWKTGTASVTSSNIGRTKVAWKKIAGFMPSVGQTTSYLQADLSTRTNLVVGDFIGGFTTRESSGITNGTTPNTWNLKAGITYELSGAILLDNNLTSAAVVSYRFETTGGLVISNQAYIHSDNIDVQRHSILETVSTIFTPTTDVAVGLKCTNESAETSTAGGYGYVTITQLGTTSTSAFTGVISPSWNISNSYPLGTMVVNQGVLYQANSFVPANTAFNVGTVGATWSQIGLLNGQAENGQVSNTTAISTTTVADVVTFTLPTAGTYQVYYGGQIKEDADNTFDSGNLRLTTTGNVDIPNTQINFYTNIGGSTANAESTQSNTILLTVTGATSYKLRVTRVAGTIAIDAGMGKVVYNKIAGFLPAVNTGTPQWINAGTINSFFNSTGTNQPVPGVAGLNQYLYRQVGPKEWEFQINFIQSSSGTAGQGDYLFKLPAGLQFDLTGSAISGGQIAFGDSIGTNGAPNARFMIPGSAGYVTQDNSAGAIFGIIFNSTQYRIFAEYRSIGEGFYVINGTTYSIKFQFRAFVV